MRSLTAIALACALLLAACGGGENNATGNSGKGGDAPAEQTAEQKRQVVVDKMTAAITSLDGPAMIPLFPADEKPLVESRLVSGMKRMQEQRMDVTIKSATIDEVEGKFFVTFKQTLEADGQTEDSQYKLQLLEVDGKWYLSFNE